ncbi:hypothetical protein DV711_16890 [Motiliproteus coralliicola]|uniref:Uncharacterized protein n=1 Tax=Motiliproteus coralliicola TaxID=2283196 RepID=A0A369WFT6_9GAMM|nr:hypothetical protein [Motiliproteus coralliicola]RDE18335.1 hypothetical protein DV711_16890 [Motiliproteus coralliicola]
MSVFNQLLRQILTLQQDSGHTIHIPQPQHSELRSYNIDGGDPFDSHQNSALLDRLEQTPCAELFLIEWSMTNSATMIESGLHLFLNRQQAQQWRDQHPNPLYHSLPIEPLSAERAARELTLIRQTLAEPCSSN